MVDVSLSDSMLRSAVTSLANAQAVGDNAAVKAATTAVDSASVAVAQADSASGQSWIRNVNVLLAVAGTLAVLFLLLTNQPWDGSREAGDRAVGVALPLAFVFFMILGLTRVSQGGVFAYVRGQDGRLSTSLSQIALWTVALSTALLYFICRDFFSGASVDDFTNTVGEKLEDFPEAYLLLLGGPFAAAVLARLVVGTKVESGRLQKVEANAAKLRDIVSNDNGQAALVDAQFFIFNLVALVWFVGRLVDQPTQLPEIPDLLVGLTSMSALAYAAAKGAESNQPIVSSITRRREAGDQATGSGIRPGDLVDIRGTNFVPEGAAREELLRRIVVRFGEVEATPRFIVEGARVSSPSDTWIIAQVPDTLPAEDVAVTVVTAAGAESGSRQLRVVKDKPVITGLEPTTVRPGAKLTVRGRYFLRPGAPASALPSVSFGDDLPVQASTVTDSALTVPVPEGLTGDRVLLSVTAADGVEPSDQVSVRLAPAAPA